MKIAMICTEKLPVPPIAGGAVQLYIEGIVPYLAQHHDITVFCIEHPRLMSEEIIGKVRYIRLPSPTKTSYIANIKEKLDSSFDLVYVFNRPLWVLSLAKSLPSTRFGLSLHNEMFHMEKIDDKKGLECIKRVEFINTVSQFIADGVTDRFPDAQPKLNVIYSGADTSKYFPRWSLEGMDNNKKLKAKYGISNHRIVLYVGRLSNKKGVDILLKAMSKVMDTCPDVALVIIGSKWYGKNETDEYTASLQSLAGNLKGPVVFTGFLPPSKIPAHYNMGDIFVCPSQWQEPLARVLYEAMAAGLPIITTNRGGNAEVIAKGKNGLLLDDHDGYKNCSSPDVLAEYIGYLLDNPRLASDMGQEGRKLAEKKYNWERVAKDVLDVLAKVPAKASVRTTPKVETPPESIIKSTEQGISIINDFFDFNI
ncbi:MAG: glycosyltransferase family 4 protein [Clostridia bacterium]|nr:glycosyltransferase family 4 protein [Clostridia bacterium]